MKNLAMFALITVSALVLAGCVQLNSDTVIKDDGSGTANLTMSLSPGMAEAIKEMDDLGMNDGQDMEMPEFEDISREDLEKACKGHGVKVTKFDKDTADGNMSLDVALEFQDLKGLSYVMGSLMGEDVGDGMGIYETADGNFVLKQTVYDFAAEAVAENEEMVEAEIEDEAAVDSGALSMTDEEKAQKQMALMGKMMGAMAELDIKFTITVPGEVIESNAPVVDGKTSIWAVNAGNMMSQDNSNMEPVIKFSSKGLKLKPIKE